MKGQLIDTAPKNGTRIPLMQDGNLFRDYDEQFRIISRASTNTSTAAEVSMKQKPHPMLQYFSVCWHSWRKKSTNGVNETWRCVKCRSEVKLPAQEDE